MTHLSEEAYQDIIDWTSSMNRSLREEMYRELRLAIDAEIDNEVLPCIDLNEFRFGPKYNIDWRKEGF